jgi:nitrogen regulatory protein P-II 1
MKKIEAIIKPFRLEDVKDALAQLGIEGMTVIEARGIGPEKGHHRGSKFSADSLPKLRIDLVLEDSRVDAAVKAIVHAAQTGVSGDGKICISTIDEVVRIRTEEKGVHAL